MNGGTKEVLIRKRDRYSTSRYWYIHILGTVYRLYIQFPIVRGSEPQVSPLFVVFGGRQGSSACGSCTHDIPRFDGRKRN